MARTLKSRGLEELRVFGKRVRRQQSMGRISHSDAEYILLRVSEIESQIISMKETDEYGKEEEDQWL